MTNAGLGLVIGFALVVAGTLAIATVLVRRANPRATVPFVVAACAWLGVLTVLALRGAFDGKPPLLAGLPIFVATALAFARPRGRAFLAALPLPGLTHLHVVRAAVEFVLFGLAMDHLLPLEMTFAGRNFDIAIGFSAPVLATLAFAGGHPARPALVIWNLIGLGFLVHVVSQAVASGTHTVLEWPFIWLPGFVVPIVAVAHVVALWRLARR